MVGHGRVAGLDRPFERLLFVGGVALHRFHQVGNQIIAPFQLGIDIGPRLVTRVECPHQAVVETDDHHQKKSEDRDRQQQLHLCHRQCRHDTSPFSSRSTDLGKRLSTPSMTSRATINS